MKIGNDINHEHIYTKQYKQADKLMRLSEGIYGTISVDRIYRV